ncbi:MAG: hypothetical protein L0332_34055 [Chloroflexi bacterium]|nr:hypothetical protein [Chloroflexota bacterium]MCI0574598.1 hypothetical protein [Chloroflexota bacterium]MCI0644050.1 hypothetical protein [Chloroflexota bacterium]MCI0731724.1 hypothetical protein [Chloroflexota bacterium]
MGELIGALILAVAGGGTVAALLATLSLLMPGLAGRAAHALDAWPGRSFLLGAVNFLFFLAVAFILAQIGGNLPGGLGGLFNLAALTIALGLLLLAMIGLTGLVALLAERMSGGAPPTAGRTLRAGILLVAAALAPVAGWFVLVPLAILAALGAAIIALAQWGRSFLSRTKEPA